MLNFLNKYCSKLRSFIMNIDPKKYSLMKLFTNHNKKTHLDQLILTFKLSFTKPACCKLEMKKVCSVNAFSNVCNKNGINKLNKIP